MSFISTPASRSPKLAMSVAASSVATCDKLTRRAKRCCSFSTGRVDRKVQAGSCFVRVGRIDGGRFAAVGRSVCASAVGQHGIARAHVPIEHDQEQLCAEPHRSDPGLPDARTGSFDSLAWLRRRGAGSDRQLPSPDAGARCGVAQQFAGRSHALAAGNPAANRSWR